MPGRSKPDDYGYASNEKFSLSRFLHHHREGNTVSPQTEDGATSCSSSCAGSWPFGEKYTEGYKERLSCPKRLPSSLIAVEDTQEEYGPWRWAAAFGAATGRFGADAFVLQENGTLRCPAGFSLWLSEVRQENAFTQRATYLGFRSDCEPCALKEQCLGRGAKGNRARRVSAVRRLLPSPAVVEQKPVVLGSMQWVDVAGRALRRSWMAHWRSQYVEVIPLTTISEKSSPPPRSPHAVRSHHRWSWPDRLASNAWWGPPQLRVTVAGVPAFLASH